MPIYLLILATKHSEFVENISRGAITSDNFILSNNFNPLNGIQM